MDNKSKIRKTAEVAGIVISRVFKGEYDAEGIMTAELKQTVTTTSYYPTKQVEGNSIQDNIFTSTDFGLKEQEFVSGDTRVAWISVPEGSTEESVAERLKEFPKANIYRILSSKPILTEQDEAVIEMEEFEVSRDSIAEKQAVRYSSNHEDAGQLIPDSRGKIQYRRTAFSKEGKEDLDIRTIPMSDTYLSPALKAEFHNEVPDVIQAQAL